MRTWKDNEMFKQGNAILALHSKNIILVDMSKMNRKGARAEERSKKAIIFVQARDNGHVKVQT